MQKRNSITINLWSFSHPALTRRPCSALRYACVVSVYVVCMCSVWVPCVALPSGGGSSAGSSPLCGSPAGGALSVVFLFPVASVPRLASHSCSRSRSNVMRSEMTTQKRCRVCPGNAQRHCVWPWRRIGLTLNPVVRVYVI